MRCSSFSSTSVVCSGRRAYSASTSALEFLRAEFVHQDLDARLVFVVAPAIEIVDAHDRFEIGEKLVLGQEVAHRDADHRRAALAAADHDFPADARPCRSGAAAGRCREP